MSKTSCYLKVPYASLIATLLCVVGVAVFCSQMYAGSTNTLRLFTEVFQVKLGWLENLRIILVTTASCMALFSVILLCVGIAATGATREQVFRGVRAKCGGRAAIGTCLVLTYVLHLAWMLILGFLLLLTGTYMIYSQICDHAPMESPEIGRCIPFRHVAFLFPETSYPGYNHDMNQFRKCGNDFRRLCDSIKNTEGIYLAATIASLVVVLSLVHFLTCLTANYTHVTEGQKRAEFRIMEALENEEMTQLNPDKYLIS